MWLGSTTMALYIPFAMWANVGAVPQWYMKTPGTLATKPKVFEAPGPMSEKSTFGATCAAWKSTECAIVPRFVSVTTTFCPSRTWMTGPGTVPPNVHAR